MIEALKPYIEESNAALRAAQEREHKKSENERDLELMEKRTLDLESLPTFFLMEDLEGRSLRDVTQQDLEDWYGEDENLKAEGQKFFTDLGKLLVFDVLIRNVDRFIFWQLPGIGEVESALGNLGNIFIRDATRELAVIDSLTDRNIEAADYANAVKEILARTLNASPDNLVDRGQETLELTGYEVKENGKKLILQGVREGINNLHNLTQGETLEQIKQESLQQLPKSEERKIDALLQFIKKVGEQMAILALVSPMILQTGTPSIVPLPPGQTDPSNSFSANAYTNLNFIEPKHPQNPQMQEDAEQQTAQEAEQRAEMMESVHLSTAEETLNLKRQVDSYFRAAPSNRSEEDLATVDH